MMRTIQWGVVLAAIVVLAGCGAKDDSKKGKSSATAAATTAKGTSDSAKSAGISGAKGAPSSLKINKVASGNGPISPDEAMDGAVDLTLDGPAKSIVLMTVDADGKHSEGQQWDTIVAGPINAGYGSTFGDGDGTWQLGVFEGEKLLNTADGSVSIPDGHHELRLYAADSGYFTKDHRFRVLAERPDGTIVASNIFSF